MRITYLHQYFATPDGSTGTRSYELARRLVSRGHDVTVVTSSAQLTGALAAERGMTRVEVDGVDLRVIGVPYRNEMSHAERVRRFAEFAVRGSVEAARIPADLVLASSTPLTIALPGLVARVARRAPMVFEVRDLWPEMPIAVGAVTNPVLIGAARALEWTAYHGAAHVVALSPQMADGVVRRGIPRERVTVIPNGCDRATFDGPEAAGDPFRSSVAGLAPGAPLIVYVGAFGYVNGVQWLADLAAAVRPLRPDARFCAIGSGAGRDALIARARSVGVLDETLFVRDPIPKRDVPAILAGATIATSLFLPIAEMEANSANKFFDALAAAKPVLINYGGWHRDLLEETGAGVAVPHADPAVAARRLVALLGDDAVLAGARDAARTLARERFDRDALAATFAALLERVAAGGDPEPA